MNPEFGLIDQVAQKSIAIKIPKRLWTTIVLTTSVSLKLTEKERVAYRISLSRFFAEVEGNLTQRNCVGREAILRFFEMHDKLNKRQRRAFDADCKLCARGGRY